MQGAHARVDGMAALMDAASQRGRHTAFKIAREESLKQLKPVRGDPEWPREHVRRFKYEPDHPEFTSRTLASLVEVALESHQRRLGQALETAATAREYARKAEAAGWQRAEESLDLFLHEPSTHARDKLRQALRAFALRATKETSRLSHALSILEAEADMAQSSHAAALRLVATKLLAQHDASVAIVVNELEDAERMVEERGPNGRRDQARAHAVDVTLLTEELKNVERSAEQWVMDTTRQLTASHALAERRAQVESRILRDCLRVEEAAAVARGQLSATLTADLELATRAGVTAASERAATVAQEVQKLGGDRAAAEDQAQRAWREAMQMEVVLHGARKREKDLLARIDGLEETEAKLIGELSTMKKETEGQQRELKATVCQLQQQNAVLRGRLVTLHARMHGMRQSEGERG